MKSEMNQQINKLSEHYNALGKQHGYSPDATQQSSLETQEKRLNVLLDMAEDLTHAKVLDFGCGTGHLYALLKQRGFKGEYVGFDISSELLAIAKQHHQNERFELKNVFEQPIEETFDWVFISGVFNNDMEYNQRFMQQVLSTLFAHVNKGLVFNALSRYVDYQSEGLYYFDPSWVFDYCKSNLTTHVQLNHSYEVKPGVIPFEFSVRLDKAPFKAVGLHD
ncbi:methyltransferase domain-containing protein [Thiomicrospira microaerophila]|uniref:methyltransferase domain-containing protein n=1 Tax=Thiomicrospira microaerophila TaxID=406020 RepID=UPI0006984495|nr:methyltransferase domain-containing protein [Thiomicrospira microaerophila]